MREITLGDTVYFNFTTRAFATGIPTTLAGTPVLSVLEENNATPITAGVSVQVDRASVAGLNQATVVATGANGFEANKKYAIYVSTGTVGGVSVVGEIVAEFVVNPKKTYDSVTISGLLDINDGVDISCTTGTRDGVKIIPGSTNGIGVNVESASSASGVRFANTGAGYGFEVAVVSAPAMYVNGGLDIDGEVNIDNGIVVTCTDTNKTALSLTGAGTGHGVYALGGSASGRGVFVQSTVSNGIYVTGGINQDVVLIEGGGSGNAITLTSSTGSSISAPDGITANITGNLTGNVTGSVGSVTGAVTVGSMNANVINAASIAASAMNGKGDWNVGKTGYTLGASGIPVGAFAANSITAASIAASALNGKGDWNTVVPDAAGTAATPAEVLTQVNAALDTAISELAQAQPSATPSIRTGIMLLYMALRNKLDVPTSGTDVLEIHNDAGTVICKKTLTDAGGDYSEAKMVAGP